MTGAGAGLSERTRTLLAAAAAAYAGRPAAQRLVAVARHLDEPLRVAIAGRVKAGKSTLLNALIGQRVAATDAGECTHVVTWYGFAREASAHAFPWHGQPRGLALHRRDGGLAVDLAELRATDLAQLRVELPSAWLTRMTLIDTPGMGSLTESMGRRTQEFLAGDQDAGGDVDAVLYLLRQLHTSDVDFLESFRETGLGRMTPVNAVGVLSRADEVGGGGAEAFHYAHEVAAQYRQDPRIRSLVHTVVPVAGLLAETAATLRREEFADLAALAATNESVTAPLLLSAARFVAPVRSVALPPEARQRLLKLLGMYGVRLSLDLIRRGGGAVRRQDLAELLLAHSGLSELRRLLLTQFAERRDVLKADSALRVIDVVARADPIPAAAKLRQHVEQLRASAHELAEIRLLTELRTGQVPAPADQLAQMERLLGGDGTAVTIRLDLPADATGAEIAAAIADRHARWRRVAANPLTDPALSRAATVLQRTCEGLSAALVPADRTDNGGSPAR